MSQNRTLPSVLDELTRFQNSLPREWLRFASRVAGQEKTRNAVPQDNGIPLEEIERFRQEVEERVIRLEALLQKAEAAFPTHPLPVEVDEKWRPVISLVKHGRTDYRHYRQCLRGRFSVGTPSEWKQNDQDLSIGIAGALSYSALKDYVCRMMRAVEGYGGLYRQFSHSPNVSEGSDYVINWIPQFLRKGVRFTAARAAELFPLEWTKRWPEWNAREFQWCLEERGDRTKPKAWEHLLEWCASESRGEFHESINRELALLRAPGGSAMTADLPALIAGFKVRLRFYARMLDHLANGQPGWAEGAVGQPVGTAAGKPEDWQPSPGYVGRKTICNHDRFRKNGKTPAATTIDAWVKSAKSKSQHIDIKRDPANGENYYPEAWIMERIGAWNPRTSAT